MPIAKEVISMLSSKDRYLISFPRSGRTWLTRCLRHSQRAVCEGVVPSESFLRSCLEENDSGKINLNEADGEWENPFTSEEKACGFLTSHSWGGLSPEASGPHLFLFRTPHDVMVSYYHYAKVRRFIDPDSVSLADFVNGNLPDWITHMQRGIQTVRARPGTWMCLSYESLTSRPVEKMFEISSRCGFDVSVSDCRAVFETLTPHFVEQVTGRKAVALSARPGSGKLSLPTDSIDRINGEAMPIYHQALELENL